MGISCEIVDPLEFAEWNDSVVASPGYTFFHSSNWARVLASSFGYVPKYCVARDNGGGTTLLPCMEVSSVLTGKRGVSLPFTDYCEPISPSIENLQSARDCLLDYGRCSGWNYIEFRAKGCADDSIPCFANYYGHSLDLSDDWDRIVAGFRDSTRRNVEKALRMGVVVEIHTSEEALREFYRLHCDTRRLHGLPPQPGYFFQSIYHHVISCGQGIVLLARYKEKSVAGAVFFHLGNQAVYKYGASDRAYQHVRANNLIMCEAIRHYRSTGCKIFCFGRTDPDADGLRQFKNGWGAAETNIRYYRYDLCEGRYVGRGGARFQRLKSLFRIMPIPLLKVIASVAYRHVG